MVMCGAIEGLLKKQGAHPPAQRGSSARSSFAGRHTHQVSQTTLQLGGCVDSCGKQNIRKQMLHWRQTLPLFLQAPHLMLCC